jgi:hypothetical protein
MENLLPVQKALSKHKPGIESMVAGSSQGTLFFFSIQIINLEEKRNQGRTVFFVKKGSILRQAVSQLSKRGSGRESMTEEP